MNLFLLILFCLGNKNDDGSTQTKGLREAALIGGIPAVAHLIGKAIDKKD
jgi:hypothetical protein